MRERKYSDAENECLLIAGADLRTGENYFYEVVCFSESFWKRTEKWTGAKSFD